MVRQLEEHSECPFRHVCSFYISRQVSHIIKPNFWYRLWDDRFVFFLQEALRLIILGLSFRRSTVGVESAPWCIPRCTEMRITLPTIILHHCHTTSGGKYSPSSSSPEKSKSLSSNSLSISSSNISWNTHTYIQKLLYKKPRYTYVYPKNIKVILVEKTNKYWNLPSCTVLQIITNKNTLHFFQ